MRKRLEGPKRLAEPGFGAEVVKSIGAKAKHPDTSSLLRKLDMTVTLILFWFWSNKLVKHATREIDPVSIELLINKT